MGSVFRINFCVKWQEAELGRRISRTSMQSKNGFSQPHRSSKAGLAPKSCPELKQGDWIWEPLRRGWPWAVWVSSAKAYFYFGGMLPGSRISLSMPKGLLGTQFFLYTLPFVPLLEHFLNPRSFILPDYTNCHVWAPLPRTGSFWIPVIRQRISEKLWVCKIIFIAGQVEIANKEPFDKTILWQQSLKKGSPTPAG